MRSLLVTASHIEHAVIASSSHNSLPEEKERTEIPYHRDKRLSENSKRIREEEAGVGGRFRCSISGPVLEKLYLISLRKTAHSGEGRKYNAKASLLSKRSRSMELRNKFPIGKRASDRKRWSSHVMRGQRAIHRLQ